MKARARSVEGLVARRKSSSVEGSPGGAAGLRSRLGCSRGGKDAHFDVLAAEIAEFRRFQLPVGN